MFSYDDVNYFSDEDNDTIADEEEIQKEKNYQNKIDIINQFKVDIAYEPEFIGIKNICSQEILDLIEDFSCSFWVKANIDRTMRAKNAIDKAKATSVKGL